MSNLFMYSHRRHAFDHVILFPAFKWKYSTRLWKKLMFPCSLCVNVSFNRNLNWDWYKTFLIMLQFFYVTLQTIFHFWFFLKFSWRKTVKIQRIKWKNRNPQLTRDVFCRHEVSLFVCGLETEDSSTRRKCFSSAMQQEAGSRKWRRRTILAGCKQSQEMKPREVSTLHHSLLRN